MLSRENICQYLLKLINLGVIEGMSSLNAIRQKYVNVVNYLLLISIVGMTILDMYRGETLKVSLGVISLIIYSVSVYFSYKEKMETSIIITCTFLNFILFSCCYSQFIEPVEIMPQIIFSIMGTLFLIPNNRIRIFYITICSVILTMIVLKYNYNLPKTIPTLVQIIISIITLNFLVLFIESQDQKLNTTVSELESSNLNIENLNDSLTIKNKEIITFTHIMTHDMKAPLNTITSFSNILSKKGTFETPQEAEFFSFIKKSSKSMQTLIQDLLQFMSIDNQELTNELIDLNNIIEEVVSNFKFELIEKKVTIDKEVLPKVFGNKQLIKTVIHNLISNAIKYQPKNLINHNPALQISVEDFGNYYNIFFKDNGIGIKEEYIPNLFEPFKRFHSKSEYKGTGLGMSICRRAMKKMNGSIELTNTSDNGSIFKLKFSKK